MKKTIISFALVVSCLLVVVSHLGCGQVVKTSSASDSSSSDSTAPSVSSINPANNATGVAINTSITAQFSEAMNSSTITTTTFTLKDSSNTAVSGTVNYSGTTATFTPSSNLSANTTYTAEVTTGVKDSAGNAMAANYTWSFTTGSASDTTAPIVSSISPANNAISVAINTSITAQFSEGMNQSTITTTTFTLKDSSNNSIPGTVSYSGTTATFRPTLNLSSNTAYTATITTSVKDLAGNAMSSSYTWSFTTSTASDSTASDSTAPSVSSISPANNATGVAINTSSITATFSEAMDLSTITTATFTVKDSSNEAVSGTLNYPSGTTATFVPQGSLSSNTAYTATITTGVKDLAGNAMSSSYTWSFTTSTASDSTASDSIAPSVSLTSPANNATSVAINTSITAAFSEAMDLSTITTTTFTLKNSSNEAVSGTLNYPSGTTATFVPQGSLSSNTTYTATITTGVKDSSGNAMAANYTWRFTTSSASDSVAPTVSSTSPTSDATSVAVNTSSITAAFSEAMDLSTITTTTFTLKNSSNEAVLGALNYPSGTTVTFVPQGNLASNTTYTATMSKEVKDSAGNEMASSYTWSFTTSTASDSTAPTVSFVSPANNATNEAIDISITAQFNEVMNSSTITTTTFTLKDSSNNDVFGTVSCLGTTATLTPSPNLSYNTTYTAEVTTGAKDLAGNAMASAYTWSFTTKHSPASLDTTFGTAGKVTTAIGTGNDYAYAAALQTSESGVQKIIVAGSALNNAGNNDFALARYSMDGILDTTFGTAGKVTTQIGSGAIAYAVAVMPNGKIVAAGSAFNSAGNYDFALARYNANGDPDTTFGTNGIVTTEIGPNNNIAYAVALQSEGIILAAGSALNNAGNYDFALARYRPNGTLISAEFGVGGKVTTEISTGGNDIAYAVAAASDEVFAVGSASNGTNDDFALVRYNGINGAVVAKGTKAVGPGNDAANALTIRSDGKIFAVGNASNGTNLDFALARYNANGTLDTTFGAESGANGIVTTTIESSTDVAYAVAIPLGGSIFAAGSASNGSNDDFALIKFNDIYGTVEAKVTTDMSTSNGDDVARAITTWSDGKIVAVGYAWNGTDYDFALARYWP